MKTPAQQFRDQVENWIYFNYCLCFFLPKKKLSLSKEQHSSCLEQKYYAKIPKKVQSSRYGKLSTSLVKFVRK